MNHLLSVLGSWTVKVDTEIAVKRRSEKEEESLVALKKRGFSLHNFPSFI